MLTPSRRLVISLVLVALVCFALGLTTDVGLVGWSLASVLALYLAVAGFARLARPRPDSGASGRIA